MCTDYEILSCCFVRADVREVKLRSREDGGRGGWEGGSKQGEVRKASGRASDIEIRATDRKQIERKE